MPCCWEVWWCTKLNTSPIQLPEEVGSLVESRYWNTCNEDECSCFSFSMCSDFIRLFLSTSVLEGINSLRYTFTYSVCQCKFTLFKFQSLYCSLTIAVLKGYVLLCFFCFCYTLSYKMHWVEEFALKKCWHVIVGKWKCHTASRWFWVWSL
jgi:hypothetical protein